MLLCLPVLPPRRSVTVSWHACDTLSRYCISPRCVAPVAIGSYESETWRYAHSLQHSTTTSAQRFTLYDYRVEYLLALYKLSGSRKESSPHQQPTATPGGKNISANSSMARSLTAPLSLPCGLERPCNIMGPITRFRCWGLPYSVSATTSGLGQRREAPLAIKLHAITSRIVREERLRVQWEGREAGKPLE